MATRRIGSIGPGNNHSMTNQSRSSGRWEDLAIIVLVLALFGQGFLPDFKTYRAENVFDLGSFLWPGVTAVSFAAVYYPFRWAYRLLWGVTAPYAVLAIPLLGFELNQRLHVASGEERWEGTGLFEMTLIHLGLVLSWATFRLMTGSRLSYRAPETARRSFGLSDSMRFTAGLAVVFAACGYWPPSLLDYLAQWTLTFFLCYGLCIIAFLSFRPQLAVPVATAGFVAAVGKRWYDWSFTRISWSEATEHFVAWIILVGALCLARQGGYRLRFLGSVQQP